MPSFEGYRRTNGRVGVRNYVLVVNTTAETAPLVRRLAALAPGVMPVAHAHGYAQFPEDFDQTYRTLVGCATNPNIFAALFVGVGGEQDPAPRLAEAVRANGQEAAHLTVRGARSLSALLDEGKRWLEGARDRAKAVPRVRAATSELIVGLECGGSDAWSGVTANPAVGVASDRMVAAGGTVILGETPEAIGAEHIIAGNAASPDVGKEFLGIVAAYEARMKATGSDFRNGNPSPGNKRGGLTTLDEKSLGCIKKAGKSPLQEVVAYGKRPERRGFVFMDTPGYDVDSVTGMAAGGAQIVIFTTGRGSPTGSPIVPVIKVATNNKLYEHMPQHIDVNAGTILAGSERIDDVGERIFSCVHEVASGALTASERQGHREFNIWRLAESI